MHQSKTSRCLVPLDLFINRLNPNFRKRDKFFGVKIFFRLVNEATRNETTQTDASLNFFSESQKKVLRTKNYKTTNLFFDSHFDKRDAQ